MTDTRVRERPPLAARRFGYALGVALNLALLYALNGIGWERLSFLTSDAGRVIWLVNLSLVAGVLANLVYAVHDPPWLKSLGDVLTTAVTVVVLVRVWQVFPFSFDPSSQWELVVRVFLVVGLVGCVIAVLTGLLALGRTRLERERVG